MNWNYLTLNKMFEKYGILNVPYYQREYVWGKTNDARHVYKLLDDLYHAYEENKNKPENEIEDYFINTLAFCSIPNETNDIVDGQQRITTILLILSVLAMEKCPELIDSHKKLLKPINNKFVLQEEYYLTSALEKTIFEQDDSFDDRAKIIYTYNKIKKDIETICNNKTINYIDFYNYILYHVGFIYIEFNDNASALKHYLNINALSIQLTEVETFYSILSQSLRIAKSNTSIYDIKKKCEQLSLCPGFNNTELKIKYDNNKLLIGINNIIWLFLNVYYKGENDKLNECGVGTWISLYKNDIFKEEQVAKQFVKYFIQYLDDLEYLIKYFTHNDSSLSTSNAIYISYILLKHEKFKDLVNVLSIIFNLRHNYKNSTLYESNTQKIDSNIINEIAKRLNLVIIKNYIHNNKNLLDGFYTAIELNNIKTYNQSIEDLLGNIKISRCFNLTYKLKEISDLSKSIPVNKKNIEVIFSCEEAFLDNIVNDNISFGEYLNKLLIEGNYTIEHLYSIAEWEDVKRREEWNKINKFKEDVEFDTERFKFINLSLLDGSTNSSLGKSKMNEKLDRYKIAEHNNQPEYLIRSFSSGSDFYTNDKIKKLNLPKRTIKIHHPNDTWEIDRKTNEEFNKQLLRFVIEKIANI